MKIETFNRFKKLMTQTTSDSDGEALNALRAANRVLAAEGITWEKVLDRSMRVEYDVEAATAPRAPGDNTEIEAAFSVLLDANLAGDFAAFIDSLRSQWNEKGRLSYKQKTALFKAADRERGRA